MTEVILHLCTQAEWLAAQERGEYRADSLAQEGFIHCSRPDQIVNVANLFFPGREGLLLLWIDTQNLESELRWEPVEGDLFPHLYGPLNLDAVSATSEFSPDPDGVFRNLPPHPAGLVSIRKLRR